MDADITTRYEESRRLHDVAVAVFPAGVNSGIRASEQPVPLAFSHGSGSRIVDVDANEYIDYQLGQGALFLGHVHEGLGNTLQLQLTRGTHFAGQSKVELSAGQRLVDAMPTLERVRFTNSATEAVIATLRLARAATSRSRIVRFEGHYHGWSDEGLAGFAPKHADWLDDHRTRPSHPSSGTLQEPVDQFLVGRFNDPSGLIDLITDREDIAAIILEPVMCNTGCIAPEPSFVDALLEARKRTGCLLIADETITGVRFGLGGAQARFCFDPDLTVLGKAIGGGLPVAAFGGRADLMDLIAEGQVTHAGTLNGNPLCMAAVEYIMTNISEKEIREVEAKATQLATHLEDAAADAEVPLLVQRVGPVIFTAVSDASLVRDYRDVIEMCDPTRWAALRLNLLHEGVRVLERGLWYLSLAHNDRDIQTTTEAFTRALAASEL